MDIYHIIKCKMEALIVDAKKEYKELYAPDEEI